MHPIIRRTAVSYLSLLSLFSLPIAAHAQKKYDPGASDTEIKIGNIVPYSGPASAYGAMGRAMSAYFDKVNADGGINGRKVTFLSVDDAYSPAKTVEQARKLVEQDEVLAIAGALGTPQNIAIQKYMNAKKVPQLFAATGANRFSDPKAFPWTMAWPPTYYVEGANFAQHILQSKPSAKIGILIQNDDFGRDYLKGFMDKLGDKAKTMVVAQATYEVNDPTVDSQMITLKAAGADVVFSITLPKFSAFAIRKAAELQWKPTIYLPSVSNSVASVLKPAGLAESTGVISAAYLRDPQDPKFQQTKEYADYVAWGKKYYPTGDLTEFYAVNGYTLAQVITQTLKMAGDNLTRENVMRQAANLSITVPLLYAGIEVKTAPDDFSPIEREQLIRFDGTRYVPIGQVIGR